MTWRATADRLATRAAARSLAVLAFALAVGGPAAAEAGDPVSWLQRIVTAAQKLNYTGTFIYQSGSHSETSRVTHLIDGEIERERLEVLDGSPREVVRTDEEVRCFLPAARMLIVERQAKQNLIPARLPESLPTLGQYYQIRKGEPSRVAGFDAQLLVLEPKDAYRYGHMLWAEANSGLLLKSRVIGDRGESLEQFAFTQLQIGGTIDRSSLQPKFANQTGGWQVRDAKAVPSTADEGQWVFRSAVPGFRRTVGMVRQVKDGAPETSHYVFSDGMAAMSVFIDRAPGKTDRSAAGYYRSGATNVYQRVQGEHLITVVGEVPPLTLKLLADGIELRKR